MAAQAAHGLKTLKIALLGAESTGKTQLSDELLACGLARGLRVVRVPEVLRHWCDQRGRTPLPHEQAAIAQEQAQRVQTALQQVPPPQWLVSDTTALTVAVYSKFLFADTSLHAFAAEHQRQYDLTLLMALDLPWVADGLQRDGPHAREPVDALLRQALEHAGVPYTVVHGQGADRLKEAVTAIYSIAS
jgi:HTH-type transcriptional regulator, transcriptional repressor of NAD biosynthesis genes